ncbi:60s ribosomal protein l16 [Stylonychia lemnae]|uniref:60s ribosomal protein l16 n=1 Tax=Stylonychia lemnae TaxID=5949 RepID=A0A078B820_STYLE|nr:60s ribosomal protein l16 [Stylonychia lemnae]|eukprot:CDW89718.1 60s ribosomal protein l16 [Stylonychia lemnae]
MFEREVVIDGRGHLLGRLASKVAKEILNGQRVVVVRCELLLRSGSLFRNKLKYHEFLGKGMNTNPRRGQFHFRSPSRIFWRVVRGMLPHKTPKGAAALGHLKVFEGIPYPYDQKRRMVVPDALKILRLKSHRKFCVLGELAQQIGWTKKGLVERLEEKRKVKSSKFWELKQKKLSAKSKARGHKELAKVTEELAKHGF